ncbi:MAG: DUF2179 domain-containing protein [Christensenellales bacterium]
MLLIVLQSSNEVIKLKTIVRTIDEDAFVPVVDAREVLERALPRPPRIEKSHDCDCI